MKAKSLSDCIVKCKAESAEVLTLQSSDGAPASLRPCSRGDHCQCGRHIKPLQNDRAICVIFVTLQNFFGTASEKGQFSVVCGNSNTSGVSSC
jgi:hypothetical protein